MPGRSVVAAAPQAGRAGVKFSAVSWIGDVLSLTSAVPGQSVGQERCCWRNLSCPGARCRGHQPAQRLAAAQQIQAAADLRPGRGLADMRCRRAALDGAGGRSVGA